MEGEVERERKGERETDRQTERQREWFDDCLTLEVLDSNDFGVRRNRFFLLLAL